MEHPKWEYICSEKMAILCGREKYQMGLDTHASSFGRSRLNQRIQQHVDR